jgi:hypothetical protein
VNQNPSVQRIKDKGDTTVPGQKPKKKIDTAYTG